MEFAEFADRAERIEAADADTEITRLVAALFDDAGEELPIVARFIQGRIFPAWASQVLDIGPNNCYEAIARAAGPNVSADDVETRLAELGEIGAVAASFDRGGQAGLGAFGGDGRDPLTVSELFETLDELATTEGDGSQSTKIEILFSLLNRCSDPEARVLARLVLGEMRIGVGEGTVRDAIVQAFLADGTSERESTEGTTTDTTARSDTEPGDPTTLDAFGGDTDPADQERESPAATPKDRTAVERALQVANDCGLVAETARDGGRVALESIDLELGRPVQAMLAQAGTVREAVGDWGAVAVEPKYDGARVQVHYDGDSVGLYSRNMEDVTDPLPEVVSFIEAHCSAPAILDGEVVAIDDNGDPLPFQEVLRRFRRKHDIAATQNDVAVEFHAFDCLSAPVEGAQPDGKSGQSLLQEPLSVRHDRLDATLSAGVVDRTLTDDPEAIERIETEALAAGHEGVMLKNPDSEYTPGSRGQNWRKRKPDVETLDLVVTGAQWGEGRRANVLGTFEVSAVDGSDFVELGNVATGITDEELETLTETLEPHVRAEEGQSVDIEPAVVFEVGYEEIQRSPDNDSGYALRFPRYVSLRPDKAPEDSDSIERIERLQ